LRVGIDEDQQRRRLKHDARLGSFAFKLRSEGRGRNQAACARPEQDHARSPPTGRRPLESTLCAAGEGSADWLAVVVAASPLRHPRGECTSTGYFGL